MQIKTELDAIERTKDDESKKFKSHNIEFDFHILIKIKEAMVDVSSTCMELVLKVYTSKLEQRRLYIHWHVLISWQICINKPTKFICIFLINLNVGEAWEQWSKKGMCKIALEGIPICISSLHICWWPWWTCWQVNKRISKGNWKWPYPSMNLYIRTYIYIPIIMNPFLWFQSHLISKLIFGDFELFIFLIFYRS